MFAFIIAFLSLLWIIVGLGPIIVTQGFLNKAFWIIVYIINLAQWT